MLHTLKIAHLDLKLENILINFENQTPKLYLADFGQSVNVTEELYAKRGTENYYMAPEIHQCAGCTGCYDGLKADVFSLGVLLFLLVKGNPPFMSTDGTCIYYHLFKNDPERFWRLHGKIENTSF